MFIVVCFFLGGYVYNCRNSETPKSRKQQLVRTGVMHSAVHLENQISLRFLRFPEGGPQKGFLMKHSEMSMISVH